MANSHPPFSPCLAERLSGDFMFLTQGVVLKEERMDVEDRRVSRRGYPHPSFPMSFILHSLIHDHSSHVTSKLRLPIPDA